MKANEGIVGNIAKNRLTGQRHHAGTVKFQLPLCHLLARYLTPCDLMTKTCQSVMFTRQPFHLVYAISTHINEWESKSIHSPFLFGLGYWKKNR